MKLIEIATLLGCEVPADAAKIKVAELAYDSRSVPKGSLFFCVPGSLADGHQHAAEAIEQGAVALVCERKLAVEAPQLIVSDARAAMTTAAAPFFNFPSRKLDLVGITGTNGKTTTAFLLESIFKAGGGNTGLIGTVVSRVGDTEISGQRTTPEAIDLQRLLSDMVLSGAKRAVMEVTSIGLERGRTAGTHFRAAVFTNLTQDHLDFHGDMESYFLAKKTLFSTSVSEAAVINVDDPYGRRLASQTDLDMLTFGLDDQASLRAANVELAPFGSKFTAAGPGIRVDIQLQLPGMFNVSNALGAVGAAHKLGLSSDVIAEGVRQLKNVPGRLETIDEGQDFSVLVDYAHTPDALERLLGAARQIAGSNRVICVFGCGGDRDKGKRRAMGRVSAARADLTVATSDNPRNENPGRILLDVEKGITEEAEAPLYQIIEDRRKAIRHAFAEAAPGDVVVIAGKGHETVQEIAGATVAFDDRLVAAEELRNMA